MVEQQNNQQGFSVVIALVAVLIIAGVGVGGWYVMNQNDESKKKSNTSQNNSTDATDKQKSEETKPDDPSEGGKYLVISEWNIRLPLTEELQGDVEYGIFKVHNGDEIAYFASKKIVAKGVGSIYEGNCALQYEKDSYGEGVWGGNIALRQSASDSTDDDAARHFKLGEYWYVVGAGNGGVCYEDNGDHPYGGDFKSVMGDAAQRAELVKN